MKHYNDNDSVFGLITSQLVSTLSVIGIVLIGAFLSIDFDSVTAVTGDINDFGAQLSAMSHN